MNNCFRAPSFLTPSIQFLLTICRRDSKIMDPPPYTLCPAAAAAPDNIRRAQRLYQFLIENIAFAYGVSQEALLEALTSEPQYLPLSGSSMPVVVSSTTEQERKEYIPLCELIRISRKHVRNNQYSLITDSNYTDLYYQLVLLCQTLGLSPEYSAAWLAPYSYHQFNPTNVSQLTFTMIARA